MKVQVNNANHQIQITANDDNEVFMLGRLSAKLKSVYSTRDTEGKKTISCDVEELIKKAAGVD